MRNKTSLSIALLAVAAVFLGFHCSKDKDKADEAPTAVDPGTAGSGNGSNEGDSSIVMTASSAASPATITATHDDPLYFTPFPFTVTLQAAYEPTIAEASTPTDRGRYLIKSSAGDFLSVNADGDVGANAVLATYSDTLSKVFEIVADGTEKTWFRIDSDLHSLYSLDSDTSGNLAFVNNWGNAASPTNRGYLVFQYDAATQLLQVKGRYTYDLSTFAHATTPDASFAATGYYLKAAGSTFKVVASSAAATKVSFHASPIDVSMPAAFNPDKIPYQPNDRVAIKNYIGNAQADMEGSGGKVLQGLNKAYESQVAAVGDDAGTLTAASEMLDAIATSLAAEGAALRHPKELYLAFRKGALAVTLASNSVANGVYGMHLVPYVYFTNEANDQGVHHPFMVVASYSLADKPTRLVDVDRPPGDGSTDGYATQRVTRDATLQLNLAKIPLRDYGLVSALTDNQMAATLNSDEGSKVANTVFNYASTSGVGVAFDGVVIYPSLNNKLVTAQTNAEIDHGGIHVGQGMGLHYHADGHSAQSNDMMLYNIHDYPGQDHPPLLGFAFDGIAVFGIYETAYATMEGYSDALDEYGGHSHGSLGYHYHAHMSAAITDAGAAYTLHVIMRGAWRGVINDIPEFWDTKKNEPAYSLGQRHKYVGKP